MKKILLFALLISSGCNSIKIDTMTRPEFKLRSFNSFCWVDGCEERFSGPDYAIDRYKMLFIRKMIQAELENAGLINDTNNPDLLVGFRVVLGEKETKLGNTMPADVSEPGQYWQETMIIDEQSYKFLEGSLVIDLIESQSSQVIAQISLRKYMDLKDEVNDQEFSKYLRKAFKEIGLLKFK